MAEGRSRFWVQDPMDGQEGKEEVWGSGLVGRLQRYLACLVVGSAHQPLPQLEWQLWFILQVCTTPRPNSSRAAQTPLTWVTYGCWRKVVPDTSGRQNPYMPRSPTFTHWQESFCGWASQDPSGSSSECGRQQAGGGDTCARR